MYGNSTRLFTKSLTAAVILALCVAICTSCPAAHKKKATKRAKPVARPVQKIEYPRAVDDQSLGFGSAPADVTRLLGRPTRVVKSRNGAMWYYDLSTVTLANGKLVGWSKYDRALPMNIGAPVPDAPEVAVGHSTVKEVVAALGTPDSVILSGEYQVWFYGLKHYTLRRGKVVPNAIPSAPAKPKVEKARQPAGSRPGKCPCPF